MAQKHAIKGTLAQIPCKIRAMAKIKYYLDIRNKERGEAAPLKLCIRHNNTAAMMATGIDILPSQWDERSEKVTGHPRRAAYNEYLSRTKLDIQEFILSIKAEGKLASMSANDIKKRAEQRFSPVDEEQTFASVFRKFICEKKKARTKEVYEYTLSRIMAFCPEAESLTFDDINRKWIVDFENFLARTSPSQNARNIHLRNIRAVFNYAIDEEVTTAYPFRRLKIRPVETAKRSLTVEQLRELFSYPVEKHQKKYIDIFRLIFCLIGINVVDLCNLKQVTAGRIEYHRAKTGRLYSIKVEPEAMEIIQRYKGESYLLDIMDRYSSHKDYMHRLNNNLQRIGNVTRSGLGGKKIITPLFPGLTTYWARHTWATIAASLDIPKETISAALGHEIGSRVTSIYINFDQNKVDEANRRVIDYVLYDKR